LHWGTRQKWRCPNVGCYQQGNRWFFVFGFEKNERANISDEELEALQGVAKALLARIATELDEAVTGGALQEICHAHED
jgi:hypothetical protein